MGGQGEPQSVKTWPSTGHWMVKELPTAAIARMVHAVSEPIISGVSLVNREKKKNW